MIRYKDIILENYSIDPVTAIITNSKGEIQKTSIHKNGYAYFKNMYIHKIQVHTNLAYKRGFDIHHIDANKLNNSLSNLIYLTRSEHTKIHSENMPEETKRKISKTLIGRHLPEDVKKKLSEAHSGTNNYMYGKRYKFINNGVENRYIPFDEDIPEGFVKGMLKRTNDK